MQWLKRAAKRAVDLGRDALHRLDEFLFLNNKEESAFQKILVQRNASAVANENKLVFSSEQQTYATVLRHVFEEQVHLTNLLPSDDLIRNVPDLPIEEILCEALEVLQIKNPGPRLEGWNGTFADLVRGASGERRPTK